MSFADGAKRLRPLDSRQRAPPSGLPLGGVPPRPQKCYAFFLRCGGTGADIVKPPPANFNRRFQSARKKHRGQIPFHGGILSYKTNKRRYKTAGIATHQRFSAGNGKRSGKDQARRTAALRRSKVHNNGSDDGKDADQSAIDDEGAKMPFIGDEPDQPDSKQA